MAELLSQQDIDNLLSGISTGAVPSSAAAQPTRKTQKEVITFDFRLPHRLSKNQLRTLQAVHESFGETFASYLLGRMQTTVSINVTSVDQIFYSEFVLSIGSPSCLYIFRIAESDALAMLEVSPTMVLAMVARLLGGDIEVEKKPRLITRIEQSIARGIILRALQDLQHSWKTIAPLTFTLERYESEGEFAQVAPASEIVLVVSFEVTIGEEKFLMNICFPTFALEDYLAKLNVQSGGVLGGGKGRERPDLVAKHLGRTTVPVIGLLGETTIVLRELLSLEPGDVLRTSIPIHSEMRALVGGKARIWGRPGISNGKVALKVTHTSADPLPGE